MKRIVVKRLDGATVLYELPNFDAIQSNFVETEATVYDPYERGSVSGGLPLPCKMIALQPSTAPRVSSLFGVTERKGTLVL